MVVFLFVCLFIYLFNLKLLPGYELPEGQVIWVLKHRHFEGPL